MSETPTPTPTKPTAPSGVGDFKKKKSGKLLPLPSGLTIRAQRPDVIQMIKKGSVINPLLEIVMESIDKGKETKIEEIVGNKDGQLDLERITDMYEMVDAVVCEVFVEPKCHPAPGSRADRSDDLLYVDEVDAEDKMFIFQWVLGGTDDIASFREEARTSLDALAEVESRDDSPEPAAGSDAG